jgi:hypothetical protein
VTSDLLIFHRSSSRSIIIVLHVVVPENSAAVVTVETRWLRPPLRDSLLSVTVTVLSAATIQHDLAIYYMTEGLLVMVCTSRDSPRVGHKWSANPNTPFVSYSIQLLHLLTFFAWPVYGNIVQ